MASFTLTGTGDYYPSGTTVAVYPRATMLADRAPSGSSVATAVAGSASVAFAGLAYDTAYAAYALVGGVHRYKTFRTDPAPDVLGLSWQGAWNAATPYLVDDAVTYGGQSFRRRVAGTTATAPDLDATNWELIAAKGVDGSGALGVDVWASQANPGTVTDWGPIINALIAGGARLLDFSDHDFPYSTQINLNDKYAITFAGSSGGVHPAVGGSLDHAAGRLIWKGGAGSGIAISMNGSDGIHFQELGLVYDSSAYDGDLTSCDFGSLTQTGNALFERCEIGSKDYTVHTARSLLRWTNAVSCTVRECSLIGAQACIRGFETTDSAGNSTTQQHPDNNRIVHNTFWSATNAFIMNVGRYWTIEDNELLFGSLGGFATPTSISSDITCISDFVYERNRHWDFANNSQKAISQLSTNTWNARIKGNFFDTHNDINVALNGPGTVVVEDNSFSRLTSTVSNVLIDLGSPATAYKNYARVKGNSWAAASTPANVIANIAGHGVLEIGPNSEASGFEALAPEVATVGGHQRAHWSGRYLPSAALAAGQPAITIDGKVQDGFGFLWFQTPGSPSVAGKLATVTFGTALEKGFGQGTPDANHQVALVILSPYGIAADSVSHAQTVAAGFGVQVANAQQTTFEIHTANAIPANTKVGIAYRVIML